MDQMGTVTGPPEVMAHLFFQAPRVVMAAPANHLLSTGRLWGAPDPTVVEPDDDASDDSEFGGFGDDHGIEGDDPGGSEVVRNVLRAAQPSAMIMRILLCMGIMRMLICMGIMRMTMPMT